MDLGWHDVLSCNSEQIIDVNACTKGLFTAYELQYIPDIIFMVYILLSFSTGRFPCIFQGCFTDVEYYPNASEQS